MKSIALGLLLGLTACAAAPSSLPPARNLVVVKGVRIPARSWIPWFARFADHLWIDVAEDGRWHRIEWNQHQAEAEVSRIDASWGRRDGRWGRQVRVLHWMEGAEAAAVAARLRASAKEFPWNLQYRAWPGPNSNTLIAWLARETAGLAFELPSTAVGKDYADWVRAGVSTTGLGVQLDTPYLGAQVGLQEGVELHFLGLTAGIGIWPPSIKIPFLPPLPFGAWRRGPDIE